MTTTANHHRHRGTAGATAAASNGSVMAAGAEPEEDIAAIAKQISDHAEAIYQTWKARGLAPDEILTCHRDSSAAADKLGTALTPQPKPAAAAAAAAAAANSLERLVNKFVVEDKARLRAAATRQTRSLSPKPFASSIQYALQKFEQKAASGSVVEQSAAAKPAGVGKRHYGGKSSPVKSNGPTEDPGKTPAATATCNDDTTAPRSWPFRNGGKTSSEPFRNGGCNADFMDEVAKEERRLIDALKNGSVVENSRKATAAGDKPAVPSKEGVLLRTAAAVAAAAAAAADYDVGGGGGSNGGGGGGGIRPKPEFLIGLSALSSSSSRRNQHAHRQQEMVPHPELTDHQRANIRSHHHPSLQSNPVRPFLTRGSVAERVLIFEKCPTELMKYSAAGTGVAANSAVQSPPQWKNIGSDVHGKIQVSLPHPLPRYLRTTVTTESELDDNSKGGGRAEGYNSILESKY